MSRQLFKATVDDGESKSTPVKSALSRLMAGEVLGSDVRMLKDYYQDERPSSLSDEYYGYVGGATHEACRRRERNRVNRLCSAVVSNKFADFERQLARHPNPRYRGDTIDDLKRLADPLSGLSLIKFIAGVRGDDWLRVIFYKIILPLFNRGSNSCRRDVLARLQASVSASKCDIFYWAEQCNQPGFIDLFDPTTRRLRAEVEVAEDRVALTP